MDVRVEQQVLTPRVQDAEETDLGSEMFWIRGYLEESVCDDAEQ